MEVSRKKIFQELMWIGLPMSASQLSQFSLMLVMLIFAGRLGVRELGGASIALGILNATGFAFGSGLCGGLETVLSHSYGRDPTSHMYGVYAQRMFLILILFTIPLSLILGYIEAILIAIGEPPLIAADVGQFCRVCIFGLPAIMLLELLRRYYASQQQSNCVFVALLVAAVLNPPLQNIAVSLWGYVGIAMGWVFLLICVDAALLLYLYHNGLYRNTWGGWNRNALNNWWPLLKLALPSLCMTLSEWTALEINSVCSGFLNSKELAAYAISSQVANLCWSGVSGFFIASVVLVGNSIGEGNPSKGKRYAIMSSMIVLLLSLANFVLIYLYRYMIGNLFTSDTAVVEIFVTLTPLFMSFHVLDTLQSNFLSILRGCGMQISGAIIVFVGLTVVGTPLGLYMLFKLHRGVQAVWMGPLLGCVFICIPAYLFVFLFRIEWSKLRPILEESSSKEGKEFSIILTEEQKSAA